ncbi:MAG: plasmid pRiA4b ORF-3 family protein [Proteobacteria bacterium]|nr:plasmid pRiA4b ORF-3 family protein [Pseudomonadota bacterium]
MKIYQLRVSIVGIGRVYRIIEISDECTFESLQTTIYNSFDMDEDHLYSFYITKKETKSYRTIWDSPEVTHPLNAQDGMGFAPRK